MSIDIFLTPCPSPFPCVYPLPTLIVLDYILEWLWVELQVCTYVICVCTYVWSHTHSHIPTHKFFTWLTDKCMHIRWLSSCRFLPDHFSFTADFCDSSKYDLELLLDIFEYSQAERIIFYHVSFASDLLMIAFSPLISWRHFSTILKIEM